MSFGSPPPKTSYGDELLLDDSWSPTGQGDTSSTSFPQQANYGDPYQRMNPMPSSFTTSVPNQPLGSIPTSSPQSAPPLSGVTLTPEDFMFMKEIRRDIILTRVTPISIAAISAMYLYNHQKQLPHKAGRYIAVGFGSVFLGLLSFRGEFKRKVSESPLRTPYMEVIRANLGLQSSLGYDRTRYGNESSMGIYGNQTALNQPPSNQQTSSSDFDSLKTEEAQPVLSYEELRAKNRGYTR